MEYESTTPVSNWLLQTAVDKLNKYGMGTFKLYAEENDLSYCDRNRCIAKCKMAYGKEDLKELKCPDRLKEDRWKFYTETLRMHPNNASELLHRIEQSHMDQFIPNFDFPKNTKGIGEQV